MPRNAELVAEAVAAMHDAAEWIACAACDGDTKSCGFCGPRVTRLRTAADALAGVGEDTGHNRLADEATWFAAQDAARAAGEGHEPA